MFHRFLRRFILFQFSLSDAEVGEDVGEDFGVGDVAGDGTEGTEGETEVFGDQIGGDGGGESDAG